MILARIILGYLSIAPMAGYDLMRAFGSSATYFWAADKAQIYRTLQKLVNDGLARTEIVPGTDAPDRIEHRITSRGRTALVDWLASDSLTHTERDEFIARIFFADALEPEALLRLVGQERDRILNARDTLRAIREETPPAQDRAAWLRVMTLEYGIRQHDALITWLDELRVGVLEQEELDERGNP